MNAIISHYNFGHLGCRGYKRNNGRRGNWGYRPVERGFIFIILTILLGSSAAIVMMKYNLDGNVYFSKLQANRSMEALKIAKQGLLAYAVLDDNRPGELPCPDFNGDSLIRISDDYRGRKCRTLLGWLPSASIKHRGLEDGSMHALWYMVSPNFFAGARNTLNPQTETNLSIHGSKDLVAIILSVNVRPDVLQNQKELMSSKLGTDATQIMRNYLASAQTVTPVQFLEILLNTYPNRNQMITITKQELMQHTRRRVVREIAKTLQQYRNEFGAYPWLSHLNITNHQLASGHYLPDIGNSWGKIPFVHYKSNAYEYATAFRVNWKFRDIKIQTELPTKFFDQQRSPLYPRLTYHLGNSYIDQLAQSNINISVEENSGKCIWDAKLTITSLHCTGSTMNIIPSTVEICFSNGLCEIFKSTRKYFFNFEFYVPEHFYKLQSTNQNGVFSENNLRTYRLSLSSPAFVQGITSIRVEEKVDDLYIVDAQNRLVNATISTTEFIEHGSYDNQLTVDSVYFPQQIASKNLSRSYPGDLPSWYYTQAWYKFIYVGFPDAFGATGSGKCGQIIDCMAIDTNHNTVLDGNDFTGLELVVIDAGDALVHQVRELSSSQKFDSNQWLEHINVREDYLFSGNTIANDYNDFLVVCSRALGDTCL